MFRRYQHRSAMPSRSPHPVGPDHATVGGGDRPTEVRYMDLKSVKEEAIEAATRALWEKSGLVPDQDSEEWEGEYRRQFELAKKRHATKPPDAARPAVVDAPPEEPPEEEP